MTAVTVDEVATYLGVSASDIPDLALLIGAAEDRIAEYIGSPLESTEVVETLPRTGTLILNSNRVIGAVAVVDGDGNAVTGYTVGSGGVLTNPYGYYASPYGPSQDLTVTYTTGFATLPDAVRLAVYYTVQQAIESQSGAIPVGLNATDDTFVVARGFAIPNRAKEYLEPYRRAPRVA